MSLVLKSGRVLCDDTNEVIGLSPDGFLGEGYDSSLITHSEPLTSAERVELAEIMMERWLRFGAEPGVDKKPEKRPSKRRPAFSAATNTIKGWIRVNWQARWWGAMDCDRCHQRTDAGYPCDSCGRWVHLVNDFRVGGLR